MEKSDKQIADATNGLSTQNVIALFTLIAAILTALISIIFANSLVGPLRKLTRVATKLSAGDVNIEIPEIKSNDEIRDLASSLKSALAGIRFLLESAGHGEHMKKHKKGDK